MTNLELGMVTIDCAHPRQLSEFWCAALDLTVAFDAGEFVLLAPNSGQGVKIGLQQVPEERTGKNRVHLDLSTADRAGEVARLVGLGATERGSHSVPGLEWTVLTDPDGNEFCIGGHH